MKRTKCPYCGALMIDDDTSIRFRCAVCNENLQEWRQEFHEALKRIWSDRVTEMYEHGRFNEETNE